MICQNIFSFPQEIGLGALCSCSKMLHFVLGKTLTEKYCGIDKIFCSWVAERSCELSLGMLKAESDTFSPPQSTSIGLHSLREMYTRACQRKCKTTIILKYKLKHLFYFIYKRSLNFSNTAVLGHKRRLFLK